MSGNGKDSVKIHVTEVEEGYVVFTVGEHAPGVDPTKALQQCLIDWYKSARPTSIWSAVSVVSDGFTSAINVWYE